MPTVHVPEPFKPILDRIASMTDADLQKVLETLTGLAPQVKPESLVKSAGESSSGLSGLEDIVQALIGLSLTKVRYDVPLDEFVRDVSRTSSKKDPTILEGRLRSLLSTESLLQSAKAFDIQHEYEKVFRSAKIITDIRPTFNPAGTEATGAMIVHNLTVTDFQNNQQLREVIFALDDADVLALKRVLERAEVKTGALEAVIGKAGLAYFESKSKD
jgi:hypothetical protein